jgi:hypothetical protein
MKTDYTVAKLSSIAESYYAMYCVADTDADIKLVNLLTNERTNIFLFECADAFVEVRIIEEIVDADDYDNCDCLSSSVTVLSKAQYRARERVVTDARFKKDVAAIAALQTLIVVA